MGLLDVESLKVYFPIRGGFFRRVVDHVKAVDGITFSINEGETYGLVGESGCGKTTTGRTLLRLTKATAGRAMFAGENILTMNHRKLHEYRRRVQMIFQDPYASLNPRKRVIDIIAEPLRNFEQLAGGQERHVIEVCMEHVGLSKDAVFKYPYEFSGGQRQRIGIARALTLRPKLLICDEPVSALDVSVQAQVLNYMKDIQQEFNLTYLFISHDLGVIRHMCDRIGIMYKGRLVEEGSSQDIYENPQHIYTKRLMAAIPNIDPTQRNRQIRYRKEIAKQYDQAYHNFFDKNGRVYPLKAISSTHSVALP
jgi:peptide/nickel transport system ATP-binding protein